MENTSVEHTIIIPGNPVPAARPRVTSARTYNPHSKYMHQISYLIKAQWPYPPITTPVVLNITFFMPIPKSKYKKLIDKLPQPHTVKPDIDNLAKLPIDAMRGIIFKDDALIYKLTASKVYSDNPRTEILIICV